MVMHNNATHFDKDSSLYYIRVLDISEWLYNTHKIYKGILLDFNQSMRTILTFELLLQFFNMI